MLTVEIYKTDKRTKAGERQVFKKDYDTDNLSMLEHTVKHVCEQPTVTVMRFIRKRDLY